MHLQEPDFFFGSRVMCFWRDPSCLKRDSYIPFLQGSWLAKAVPRKDYFMQLRSPAKSTSSFSPWILCPDVMSWAQTSRTPKNRWPQKRDAEKSTLTNTHHTHCALRQLGTTAAERYEVPRDRLQDSCLLARVRWGNCCEGTCSKEHPHYHIRQSARNLLEQDQGWRVLWKSARSCHRTSNNQPRFTSLEIPWGFLA